MDALKTFKEIFWDAFHRPALKTAPFVEIWQTLEPLNDLLAGPLYAIYDHGDCNYVFQDEHRFPGLHDADDFLNWCVELVERYRTGIDARVPETEEEENDKELLLFQTDRKMELADLAYGIMQEKFTS